MTEEPIAKVRVKHGLCPECGFPANRHDANGGPDGCTLTDRDVTQRLKGE